ncbi:hypothetical protein [Govanella unica]|uniref:Uncharacterized protein n=1 Tax=Govanella unica TaxID=2975056 RepID=A0A9X3U0I8_9PROT|nr:hypothetical protein [Govania unica]MDA5195115.1 hypothetical protein [Govania unica]
MFLLKIEDQISLLFCLGKILQYIELVILSALESMTSLLKLRKFPENWKRTGIFSYIRERRVRHDLPAPPNFPRYSSYIAVAADIDQNLPMTPPIMDSKHTMCGCPDRQSNNQGLHNFPQGKIDKP